MKRISETKNCIEVNKILNDFFYPLKITASTLTKNCINIEQHGEHISFSIDDIDTVIEALQIAKKKFVETEKMKQENEMTNRKKLIAIRRYINIHGDHAYSSNTKIVHISYYGVVLELLDGTSYQITLDDFCKTFSIEY